VPRETEKIPRAFQNLLARLFGSASKEAQRSVKSPTELKKTLRNILKELDRYRRANVRTDGSHELLLDCALCSADEALKGEDFWPGYAEGVLRFALVLMGDYPNHHRRKTGTRKSDDYKLDHQRSIVFVQTPEQKFATIFHASEQRLHQLPPFSELMDPFYEQYGYVAKKSRFIAWFKKTYPEAYCALF
jgi:hypothetical protein